MHVTFSLSKNMGIGKLRSKLKIISEKQFEERKYPMFNTENKAQSYTA